MSERVITDPSQHGWVEVDGKWVWDASGGAGAGMVISDSEPTDKIEGMQWLENTTGKVWIWDSSAWFEFPEGKDGKDGADGADGVGSLWTDNGDTTISYNDGNVGIGIDPVHRLTVGDPSANVRWSARPLGEQVLIYSYRTDENTYGELNHRAHSYQFNIGTGSDGRKVVIDNDGRVGIGEDTPASSVHIRTGNSSRVQATDGTASMFSGVWGDKSRIESVGSELLIAAIGANYISFSTDGTERMRIDDNGRVDITGSLYVNGTPKIGTSELIETLSTLRNATKDETVDVRQALASACDEMIEKFEAMEEVES